ncbi:acetyl ornithine aminotransferase family protein [Caldilinea sp.]|jgi:4-aminobutyrate aminotransferase|nr:acetyl ornithine aminotransferase family protein [Caldilinea sp.]GIV69512.1 MAG: aspartate aminotransferase family protein [Caldilinea sp.]
MLRTNPTRTISRLHTPGPKARAILERDRAVVSRAYGRVADFVMSHGVGSQVWDVDGNRYLDFMSGIAVNSTGHSHPHVVRAIQEQAEKFLHISSDYYHESWVRLSERLDEIAPFAEPASVFLGNSGTEAVEGAIKLARYHTGRPYFLGFIGGFHGRTLGSLGFTASKITQRRGFLPQREVIHVPYPYEYRPLLAMQPGEADYGETVVNYIERVIFKNLVSPDEVAAVLVEPIQGEGGYVVPPASFFPRLRKLCDRHGILLIVDEVQTGMGRTGKWWAIEHWGVEPDIVCTAKGIASGVPLGGFIARQSVATWPTGAHGNTYGGNPLAMVAALATMEVLENGGIQNAAEQGAYMLSRLHEMAARHPSIGDVRGKGLMIGVEFVQDKATRAPNARLRDRIIELAFEHGLLIMGCGVSTMRIIPPLVITRPEVDEGLEIFEHALTLAEEELM